MAELAIDFKSWFSVGIFNKLYGKCQCEHYNPMISLFIPIYNAKLANLMLILHVLISFSRVFRMEYNEQVKSLLFVETFRHWRGIFRVFFPFCINRYAISTKHSAVSITNTTSDYICYTLIILAAPFYMLPKWLFNSVCRFYSHLVDKAQSNIDMNCSFQVLFKLQAVWKYV